MFNSDSSVSIGDKVPEVRIIDIGLAPFIDLNAKAAEKQHIWNTRSPLLYKGVFSGALNNLK